jgi:TetR/AcrR family transcriptional repressor of nem operon
MKVSREHAAENRERILDTAARMFRERGLSGVGAMVLARAVDDSKFSSRILSVSRARLLERR